MSALRELVSHAVVGLAVAVAGAASAQAEPPSAWGGTVYGGTNQGHGDLSVDDGYSSVGALFGRQLDADNLDRGFAFAEVRGHLVNDGTRAYNTHLGYRWLGKADGTSDENQWVYGINGGYDGREYDAEHTAMGSPLSGATNTSNLYDDDTNWFHWCRAGAEALGNKWELRANGYIDCGDHESLALEAVSFRGNTLLVETLQQRALWGIDASVSRRFKLNDTTDLTGKLTGYTFDAGDFDAATGGRLSLNVDFGNHLQFGGMASWDTLFGFNGLVNVKLRFNTAPGANQSGPNVRERLIRPIERQELVVIDEQLTDRRVLTFKGSGTNGGDAEAVPFFHVDNTSNAGGDGSFENRFRSVAEAQKNTRAGDVIIIHKGNGTSRFYDTGFALKNRQTVLGAGFSGGVILGGKDVWYLPGKIRSKGVKVKLIGKPTLTNPDGNIITLADDNQVGYLRLTGAGENGIYGEDINNVQLYDNWIFDSQGSGILIDGFTGTADIRGNGVFRNLGQTAGDDGGGIQVLDAAGQVLIRDNICGDFARGGNGSGGLNGSDCIEVTSKTTGDLFALIGGNSVRNNNGDGIELHHLGSGTFTAVIEDNVVTHNTESAIAVLHEVGSTGAFNMTIRGNNLSNSGFSALELLKFANTGEMNLLIDGNVIDSNGAMSDSITRESALNLDIRSNVTNVTITNNTITNNSGPGISAILLPQGLGDVDLNFDIRGNTITGNGFGRTDDYTSGIFLAALSAPGQVARIDAVIEDNFIQGNNGFGVSGYTVLQPAMPPHANPIVCTELAGNTGTDNYLLSQNGGVFLQGGGSIPGGGTFFLDPASGGNTGAINTIGTIGSASCG